MFKLLNWIVRIEWIPALQSCGFAKTGTSFPTIPLLRAFFTKKKWKWKVVSEMIFVEINPIKVVIDEVTKIESFHLPWRLIENEVKQVVDIDRNVSLQPWVTVNKESCVKHQNRSRKRWITQHSIRARKWWWITRKWKKTKPITKTKYENYLSTKVELCANY